MAGGSSKEKQRRSLEEQLRERRMRHAGQKEAMKAAGSHVESKPADLEKLAAIERAIAENRLQAKPTPSAKPVKEVAQEKDVALVEEVAQAMEVVSDVVADLVTSVMAGSPDMQSSLEVERSNEGDTANGISCTINADPNLDVQRMSLDAEEDECGGDWHIGQLSDEELDVDPVEIPDSLWSSAAKGATFIKSMLSSGGSGATGSQ
ncbi:Hypothetical protein PHPALM_6026 [Phytophthora palmivora]|uniref:Uncharacterized protein n=1 Tax=Phytophthora palmivora TaxID=4796 RepID=A0A2P4YFY4_9STRA|nr:Hypothetical protein PHPALM_6026 [Phytophthora palmivora]